MKKFIAMVMVVALLASMAVCFAENKVSEYKELLKGTWEVQAVINNGAMGTKNLFARKDFGTIDFVNQRNGYITGNELGNVYFTLDAGLAQVCGEITFSEDKNTVVLLCTFDCTVILTRK